MAFIKPSKIKHYWQRKSAEILPEALVIMNSKKNQGLHGAKQYTTAAGRQGKVEQVYIKSKLLDLVNIWTL